MICRLWVFGFSLHKHVSSLTSVEASCKCGVAIHFTSSLDGLWRDSETAGEAHRLRMTAQMVSLGTCCLDEQQVLEVDEQILRTGYCRVNYHQHINNPHQKLLCSDCQEHKPCDDFAK